MKITSYVTSVSNIPKELQELKIWTPWNVSKVAGKTHNSKRPLTQWKNGEIFQIERVLKRIEKEKDNPENEYKANAVGMLIPKGYYGIDIDECINDFGELNEEAKEVLSKINSYTEISLSGHGLHIIAKSDFLGKISSNDANKGHGLEMYQGGERNFVITGNVYEGRKTINDCDKQIRALYEEERAYINSKKNKSVPVYNESNAGEKQYKPQSVHDSYLVKYLTEEVGLQKDRKGTRYICPICGSGTGENGTGAFTIYKDTNSWKCFSGNHVGKLCKDGKIRMACNHQEILDEKGQLKLEKGESEAYTNGNLYTFIMEYKECTFPEAIKEAERFTGINGYQPFDIKQIATCTAPEAQIKPYTNDLAKDEQYTMKGENNVLEAKYEANRATYTVKDFPILQLEAKNGRSNKDFQRYMIHRGLINPNAKTEEQKYMTISKYKIGYLEKTKQVFIPISSKSAILRAIDGSEPKYITLKGSNQSIYNKEAITDSKEPIFIVEGVFDAISVLEALGKDEQGKERNNVIAIRAYAGKKTEFTEFINTLLSKHVTVPDFILSLDNDESGEMERNELARFFEENKIGYSIQNISGDCNDPNDLFSQDRVTFINEVVNALEQHPIDSEEIQEELEEKENSNHRATYDYILNEVSRKDGEKVNIPDFETFSEVMKLRPHESVIVGAGTGGGKTAFACNLVSNLLDKYPCMYFDLEMTDKQMFNRLLSIRYAKDNKTINHDEIDNASMNPYMLDKLKPYIKEIANSKPLQMFNDDYTLEGITSTIERVTRYRKDTTFVFIDHALLMNTFGKSNYEKFSTISTALRQVSIHNNIILILLSQFNRESKKDGQEPSLSAFKESGSFENDATRAIALYKDYYGNDFIYILKNRDGKTGKLPYKWRMENYRMWEEEDTKLQPLNDEYQGFLDKKKDKIIERPENY